jgi:hypothetical protein
MVIIYNVRYSLQEVFVIWKRGRSGNDRMVIGFTAFCAISAYHHESCEFETRSWRFVLDTILCDKVCQ